MITHFLVPPVSFNELLTRLGSCYKYQDFADLKLRQVSTPLSLELVLKAIRFPLYKYSDITEANIELFSSIMSRLLPFFPEKTSNDARILEIFLKNIPVYSRTPVIPDPRTLVANISVPKNTNMSLLASLEASVKIDPKIRLTRIMQAGNTVELTPNDRAEKLQQILNLIFVEQQILIVGFKRAIVHQEAHKHKQLSHIGFQVIPVAPMIQSMVENSEKDYIEGLEFSTLLQLNSAKSDINEITIDLGRKVNPILIAKLTKILNKLNELIAFSKLRGEEWHLPLETGITGAHAQLMMTDVFAQGAAYAEVARNAYQSSPCLRDSIPFDFANQDFNAEFRREFPNCVPFHEHTFRKYNAVYNMGNSGTQKTMLEIETQPLYSCDSFDKDQIEMYEFCQKGIELQPYQAALYKLAYQELDTLIKGITPTIKNDLKLKVKWLNFKKELFGNQNQLPAMLPPVVIPSLESLAPHYHSVFGKPKSETSVSSPASTKNEPKGPVHKQKQKTKQQGHKDVSSSSSSSSSSSVVILEEEQSATTSLEVQPKTSIQTIMLSVQDLELFGSKPLFTLNEPRIQRWFNHPLDQPMTAPTFEDDYVNKPLDYQRMMIEYHGFTQIADRFYDLGIQTEYAGNTQYLVAGEILRNGEEKPVRVVVNWTFDANTKICFHRYCHTKKDREIIEMMKNQAYFQESDFPTLEEAMKKAPVKQRQPKSPKSSEPTVNIDKMFGNVTIYDPRLQLSLTLFRSKLFFNNQGS